MIIIDFFGLPGCGKSTVSHKLAEELRRKGYTVEEPSWSTDRMPSWLRMIRKTIYSVAFMVGHHRDVSLVLKELNSQNLSFKTKIKLQVNLCYIMHMVLKKSNSQYKIFDQGIIQAVVSLYTENSLCSYNDTYKAVMSTVGTPVLPIYIKVNVGTALRRLSGRANGKSRTEKLDETGRRRMLSRITELCEGIDCSPIVYRNESAEIDVYALLNEVDSGVDNVNSII